MKNIIPLLLLCTSIATIGNTVSETLPQSATVDTHLPETPILGPWRAGGALQPFTDSVLTLGQLVIRHQKAGAAPQFFMGRAKGKAWELASGFSLNVINPWNAFRQGQFFVGSRQETARKAVEQIYFDGHSLMVLGKHDSLFMQFGDAWFAFPALSQAPALLEITSWPPGAQVYLEGELRGKTPLQLSIANTEQSWIRLVLEGHYIHENLVTLNTGKRGTYDWRMEPLPVFFSGEPVAEQAFSAVGTMDLHEARNALENILRRRPNQNFTDLNSAIILKNYTDTLTQRMHHQYFRPEAMRSMGGYDSELQGLPIRLWISQEDGFDFQFEGVLHCLPEEYPALRQLLDNQANSETLKFSTRQRRLSFPGEHTRSTMDGWLRLSYRNWSLQARTQSRLVQRYYALESLDLILPDRNYSISGLFIPPAYIRNTLKWRELTAPLQ